ncbi:FG-GAP-like repeat-containing protein, partial [Planctomycetota bacterium]
MLKPIVQSIVNFYQAVARLPWRAVTRYRSSACYFVLEQLQARVLLSATITPVPEAPIDSHQDETPIPVVDVEFSELLTPEFDADLAPAEGSILGSDGEEMFALAEPVQYRHELVFVDSSVPDYQHLVDALWADRSEVQHLSVVVIGSEHDGIEQISQALAGYHDLNGVHIISHGTQNGVMLGKDWLDSENLDSYADQIAKWRSALSEDADLLFYGCNLAAGPEGLDVLGRLKVLTGADVAASADVTGSTLQGGDWELEWELGDIETELPFNPERLETWAGILAAPAAVADSYTLTEDATLTAGGSASFTAHTVDSGAGGAHYLEAADIDDDGDMDLVGALWDDDDVVWYENDGSENFTEHVIDATMGGVVIVRAVDIDEDGDIDVFAVGLNESDIHWYENDGSESFTQRTITTTAAGLSDFQVGDIDGDNDLDIVVVSENTDDSIFWYENNGSESFSANTISTSLVDPRHFSLFDLDEDNDLDIVVTSMGSGDDVLWYANNGSGSFTSSTVGSLSNQSPTGVDVLDVDGDGDLDILASTKSGDKAYWFKNDGSESFTTISIGSALPDGAWGIEGADMDGDGDTDVLVATYSGFFWYENDGSESFTKTTIETGFSSNRDIKVADVDLDGDMDVLATAWGEDTFKWYENDGSGVGVLANDSDPEGNALTAVLVSGPSNAASFTLNSDGSFTYTPTAGFDGEDSFTYKANDGSNDSNTVTVTLTVSGDSDSPVNTVPGGQTTNVDTAKVFSSGNGNQISITDVDAGSDDNEVTLSVTNGSLTLAGITGLSFTVGDGTADTTMTFRGTASAINTALDGLSYSPTASFSGSATLTLSTKDSVLLSLDIDTSLKGHYTYENTGALGTDTSPAAGYTGTVSGATSDSDGTRGNVLSLDGNDYVQITGHFSDPADVTVAAWVNLISSDTQGADVISLGDSVVLRLDSGAGLSGSYYDGSSWNMTRYSTSLAGTGWHHVAYSFDDSGNTATLYLDGVAVNSDSTTSSISYTLGAHSYIGKHGDGSTTFDFNGSIDDSRIYNRALTAREIATLAADLTMTDTDTVAITVNAVNDAPIITSDGGGSTASVNAAENQTVVTTVTSTDAEDDTRTYSISGGDDQAKFSIDSGSGALTFQSAPDYESPTDDGENNTYVVEVTSSDGNGGTDTQTITVTVTDVSSVPATANKTVTTNEDTAYTFTVSDFTYSDGDNEILDHVQITKLPTAGSFQLSGVDVTLNQDITRADIVAGNLTFTPASDANGSDYASFEFRVSDGSTYSAAASTSVKINASFASDADGFTYADDTFNSTSNPTHAAGSYDGSGGYSGGGLSVTLGGAVIGSPVSGGWSKDFTVTESSLVLVSIRYRLDFYDGYEANEYGEAILEVDGTRYGSDTNTSLVHYDGDGPVYDSGWCTYEVEIELTAGDHTITVGAFNNDATSATEVMYAYFDDITVTQQGFNQMTVDVTALNDAPVITSNGGGATASVNAAENQTAVTTVTSTDADGDTRTYSISGGADQTAFSINSGSGALTFQSAPDYESPTDTGSNNTYVVEVTASDGNGGTDTQTITVTVTDANDAPIITSNGGGSTASVNAAENQTAVTTVTTTDDDADTRTYSISGGADQAKFSINSSSGALSFSSAPNYESPTDSDENNTYVVEVTANDGEGGTDTQTITVTVTNVNEAPTIGGDGDGDGIVITDMGSDNDQAVSMAVQSDGKVVVVGSVHNGSNYDFAIVRYNADGSLDTAFDTDGKITTAIGSGDDYGQSVAIQSDGKIVVTGYSHNGSNYDIAVVRYNTDGSLDTSFDSDGKVTTAVGSGHDYGRSVVIQSDGKIVVAGDVMNGANRDYGLLRYDTDGSLDTSFDSDGIYGVSTPADEYAYSIVLQSDGKILLAGSWDNGGDVNFSLSRHNTDGSLDTSFDTDGKLITNLSSDDAGRSVVLQSDGKILLAGYQHNGSNYDFALLRYNSDGSLDTDFGSSGAATSTFGSGDDYAYSVAVQDDGKIVVVGEGNTGSNNDFCVARFDTDGNLDTDFDSDGKVSTDLNSGHDYARTVLIQDDGKILVAGYATNGSNDNFALVRYNTNGSLDTAFDAPGLLNATPEFTEDGAAIVLDSDVQIVDVELGDANNYSGATLTLARNGGANSDDVFGHSGNLSTLTESGNLVLSGVTIGTVTTNSGGTLVLTFNSNATQARVNETLQSITYANSDDTPSASEQIDWTFDDGNTGSQGSGDALSVSGSITVSLSVTNDAPVITSDGGGSTASVNAAENQTTVTTVTSTDAEGDTRTYSISGGDDQAKFSINSSSGALAFQSAPNYESPTDTGSNNTYVVEVTSSDDNGGTDTQTITVTVTNVNEAIDLTSNGGGSTAAVNVAENTTAVTTVTASDIDGDTPVFSIIGGADQAKFSINSSSGALTFDVAPDYETPTDDGANNTYLVQVRAADGNGSTDDQTITVTVTDANDAPVITSNGGASTAAVNVAENTTAVTTVTSTDVDGDTRTYSISGGDDQAKFSINSSSGALTFTSAPDYESPTDTGSNNTYVVEVTASDGNGGTDTQTITVTVTDANDAPSATADSYQLTEDGSLAAGGSASFTAHTIDSGAVGAHDIEAVDMDGDGDMDLVGILWDVDDVVWYENDGSENFTEHVIDANVNGAIFIHAVDIDEDGDIDIFATGLNETVIHWYENNGSESFTTHTIASTASGLRGFQVGDIDGDNDLDLVVVSQPADASLFWYENNGSESFSEHTISTSLDIPRRLSLIDLDEDNDLDVVVTRNGSGNDAILWYANNGSGSFTEYTVGSISTSAPTDVDVLDVDGDGDLDILASTSNDDYVYWFKNDGSESFTTISIGAALPDGAWAIEGADMDGDSDVDVLVATDSGFFWYENDGSESFTKNTIETGFTGNRDINAADVDSDGDLDVLVAAHGDDTFKWYENDGSSVGVLANDSDLEGDPLTAVLVSGPSNAASFSLNSDGSFTYTPTADFSGEDSFTYKANDGTNDSATVTVTLTVTGVNDAP